MTNIYLIFYYKYIFSAEIGNICTVSGSINYRTYDDVILHFTGTCKYLLSGVANEKIGQGYPGWRVLVSNQRIVSLTDLYNTIE